MGLLNMKTTSQTTPRVPTYVDRDVRGFYRRQLPRLLQIGSGACSGKDGGLVGYVRVVRGMWFVCGGECLTGSESGSGGGIWIWSALDGCLK